MMKSPVTASKNVGTISNWFGSYRYKIDADMKAMRHSLDFHHAKIH